MHPHRKQPLPEAPPAKLAKPNGKPAPAAKAMPVVMPLATRPAMPGFPKPRLGSFDPAPSPAESLAAHPLRMGHKTHRQMTQGKLRPEARIDLHGMTLATAHPTLIGFLMTSHTRGFRLVLVITGKGKAGSVDAPLPIRPGALRHNVPHWLGMMPLAQIVLQVTPAHRRHGGEGAYYVYLRKSGVRP